MFCMECTRARAVLLVAGMECMISTSLYSERGVPCARTCVRAKQLSRSIDYIVRFVFIVLFDERSVGRLDRGAENAGKHVIAWNIELAKYYDGGQKEYARQNGRQKRVRDARFLVL